MSTCSVKSAMASGPQTPITVNGVKIARDLISREAQNHPSATPIDAWKTAAQSLVVRELLIQEARRKNIGAVPETDDEGRRETEDEAKVRVLIETEVVTPEPDAASCRRYYEMNRAKFRSADLIEASHILVAASPADQASWHRAKRTAHAVLAMLADQPDGFAEFASSHSDCPSKSAGGNLGQLTAGSTVPEFEAALKRLAEGETTREPVASRYGWHIIRLDRRIRGRELPYELVAERIAAYLKQSVQRRAAAQYVARLVSAAEIKGFEMPGADEHRVH